MAANQQPAKASADLASKFPPNFLEGVDFIETEEDAKAVEAATLKIQSTFRGKKFGRAKKTPEPPPATKAAAAASAEPASKSDPKSTATTATPNESEKSNNNNNNDTKATPTNTQVGQTSELSKRIGAMQVNDNEQASACKPRQQSEGDAGSSSTQAPEEEVERAATKIQAGFKGYKTRKELEGKLTSGGPAAGSPDAEQVGAK